MALRITAYKNMPRKNVVTVTTPTGKTLYITTGGFKSNSVSLYFNGDSNDFKINQAPYENAILADNGHDVLDIKERKL